MAHTVYLKRDRLDQWRRENYDTTYSRVAEAAGISKGLMSTAVRGKPVRNTGLIGGLLAVTGIKFDALFEITTDEAA